VLDLIHFRAQSIEVHLGAERINDPNEPGHVIMIATEIIVHENFDFVGNKFDIALIKLPTLVAEQSKSTLLMYLYSWLLIFYMICQTLRLLHFLHGQIKIQHL
jgi:hypothetical protein